MAVAAIVFVVVLGFAFLAGEAGYREALDLQRSDGRPLGRIPPLLWGVSSFLFLLPTIVVFSVARRRRRRAAADDQLTASAADAPPTVPPGFIAGAPPGAGRASVVARLAVFGSCGVVFGAAFAVSTLTGDVTAPMSSDELAVCQALEEVVATHRELGSTSDPDRVSAVLADLERAYEGLDDRGSATSNAHIAEHATTASGAFAEAIDAATRGDDAVADAQAARADASLTQVMRWCAGQPA